MIIINLLKGVRLVSKEIFLVTNSNLLDKDSFAPSTCMPNLPCTPNTSCVPFNCQPALRPCMPDCAPAPQCAPSLGICEPIRKIMPPKPCFPKP